MPIELKNTHEVVNAAFVATATAGVGSSLNPLDGLCDPQTKICGNFGGTAGLYLHSRFSADDGRADLISLLAAGYDTNDNLTLTYNPLFPLGTLAIFAGPEAGLTMRPRSLANGLLDPSGAFDMTLGARAFALVPAGSGGKGIVLTFGANVSNLAHALSGDQAPIWGASAGIAIMLPSDLR